MTQILPDGEYDLDLSGLDGTHDPCMALCYGVSESLDTSKPMYLYDDTKNLILEAMNQSQESLIFEGVNQVHSKPPSLGSYFLKPEDGKVKLKRLNNTTRFSKSRNGNKWKNILNKRSNDDDIIGEGDFDDLEFEMKFDENQIEFDDLTEVVHNDTKEQNPFKDNSKDDSIQNRDANKMKEPTTHTKDKLTETPKQKTKENPIEKQPQPRLTRSRSNSLVLETRPSPPSRTSNSKVTKPVSRRANKSVASSKTVSKSSKPEKSSKVEKSSKTEKSSKMDKSISNDDDFNDLEHQLEEILEDSSDDEYTGAPITIIDDYKKSKTSYSTASSHKPISLREFMGDQESSSEEE